MQVEVVQKCTNALGFFNFCHHQMRSDVLSKAKLFKFPKNLLFEMRKLSRDYTMCVLINFTTINIAFPSNVTHFRVVLHVKPIYDQDKDRVYLMTKCLCRNK